MCCWWVCVDRYVILGGHRDAWVFGGIDPMSGAAVVHETVRSAGRLLSTGMIFPVSEWNNYCINTQDSLTSVCVCRLEAKEDYNICQLGCRGVWTAGIYRMGRGTVYAHTIFKTHRIISLHPSRQDNARLLQERAVAYINADSAIEGENAFLLKKWLSARLFLVLFVCVNVFLNSRYVHSEGWLHSITAYFGVWHHEAGGQI